MFHKVFAVSSETTFPNEKELVVNSQILAGGRGLGNFTSGLQGEVQIVEIGQVEEIAGKMLGQTLVTKQTGPQGKVVSKISVGLMICQQWCGINGILVYQYEGYE